MATTTHSTGFRLALVAAVLVLVSGSAYAGQTIAKNAVRSKQVKNNSLTSKDIKNNSLTSKDIKNKALKSADVKDGTLTSADVKNATIAKGDLAAGAAPEVYSFNDQLPADGVARTLVSIPDFSRFVVTCTASGHSIFIGFGPPAPPPPGTPRQSHGMVASDKADNNPVAGATVLGPGGGVGTGISGGASPGSGILFTGEYYGRSKDRVGHGGFSLGYPSSGGCLAKIFVTVQRLAVPKPLPDPKGTKGRRGGVCMGVVGNAVCRTT